ncbi:MAG: CvpA family protein [Agathobacter sp.]
MNWLLLVVIALIAGNIVWGYSKGFLRVAYSLVEWLLIFLVISRGTPYVLDFLNENTNIPQQLTAHCERQLQESVGDWLDPNVEDNITTENSELPYAEIKLPVVLVDNLLENTGAYTRLAEGVAQLAVEGLAYLLAIVLTLLVFYLIGKVLKIVDKIPVIHGLNRLLGVGAGFVKGMMLVWLLFGLIAFCVGTAWGQFLLSYIYEAEILTWLYENNYLLTILFSFL